MTNSAEPPKWQVICGDAFAELQRLPAPDAVIMDPPYGINWEGHSASTRTWGMLHNDDGSLDLRTILRMACTVIAFGANCYPDQLPHRGRWLCWDKRTMEAADRMLGSPFELAWINRKSGFDRMYRVMHGGVVNADGWGEKRLHPTQKPIALMSRLILDHTKPNDLVIDPFCGSGSTGIAAVMNGRRFIGIELDDKYARIATARIKDAAEGMLFTT
jgi:tRNA G10  N-methylase Trm11